MVSTEVKASRSRPILFKGEMVRAILGGAKTQTRRIVHLKMTDKPCPYGVAGDTLWVRETFCEINGKLIYRATAPKDFIKPGCWQRSIFMPREACRLELKILDTWVEPLNSISEEDAIAEGIVKLQIPTLCRRDQVFDNAIEAFKMLWEKINGAGSWEKNPMVWVIEFEVIK
ncbi:hypothetical protein [Kamptonema sp. UHCC 0994]|uniref:hypothetical protein n=1 Tax=Kamptonema sp. UHCC 0994 TaxID=3031329 RepID=UPI0023B9F9ED|nr:hypothetical protein [Kamptonema sp. UHCC 0994]MDF0553180.1 hypothetical protein [Kamptonema sp. UHCC 0994]